MYMPPTLLRSSSQLLISHMPSRQRIVDDQIVQLRIVKEKCIPQLKQYHANEETPSLILALASISVIISNYH